MNTYIAMGSRPWLFSFLLSVVIHVDDVARNVSKYKYVGNFHSIVKMIFCTVRKIHCYD